MLNKVLRWSLVFAWSAAACGETVHLNGADQGEAGGAEIEGGSSSAAGADERGEAGNAAGGDGGRDVGGATDAGGAAAGTAAGGEAVGAAAGAPTTGAAGAEANGGAGPVGSNSTCIGEVGATNEFCSALEVPGGTFKRTYDGVYGLDESFPATVSSFYLEKYEVSVGRMRAFLGAGWSSQQSPPPSGAGAHPKIPGSGWKSAWNAQLAQDPSAATAALKCDLRSPLRADMGLEGYPIPCVTWYEAFAFCAWSGGRLPTMTEWNYAAAGGDEQRVYPWSNPPSSTDIVDVRVVYNHNSVEAIGDLPPFRDVTTRPSGAARWGHYNLAGNLSEWVFDQEGALPVPCNDCALFDIGNGRLSAGGAWFSSADGVLASSRGGTVPSTRSVAMGFRCAFDE